MKRSPIFPGGNVPEHVDVAVIGGGPAGCAVALLLAKAGCTVTIIESGDNKGWKIGEGLPPSSRHVLQQLGIWESFVADGHLPSYGNCSSWGSRDLVDQSFIFNPYGHGWHLDRRRFDNLLARAAKEAGAARLCGTKVDACTRLSGIWRLELVSKCDVLGSAESASTRNVRSSLDAEFVVDATGRAGWFARHQGARPIRYDDLVGLIALLDSPGEIPDTDTSTLIEAVEAGWWYSALLADGRLVVAFFSDGDLGWARRALSIDGWRDLLNRTAHIQARIDSHNYFVEAGPRIVSASTCHLSQVAADSWLAVGDAAASYDPLSSQGIQTALEMAVLAASAILQTKAGAMRQYVQAVTRTFSEYLANRWFYYAKEQRWPDSPFWKRRQEVA